MDVDKIADGVFKAVDKRISSAVAEVLPRLDELEARSIPEEVVKELLSDEKIQTLIDLHVSKAQEESTSALLSELTGLFNAAAE